MSRIEKKAKSIHDYKGLRIGAACVFLDDDGHRSREKNLAGTTVKALTAMNEKQRTVWLSQLIMHNMDALDSQMMAISLLPPGLRMWRLSGDMLPIPTHPITELFYKNAYMRSIVETRLASIGDFARTHGIRLSFHPGQFVVLGSLSENIRNSAVRELSYHSDLFHMMGYKDWHQNGCAVNVHVGPKIAETKAMRKLLIDNPDMSKFVTLENEEFSWSARAIVDTFGDLVPVVLDIHHYWIMHDRRIRPDNPLIDEIRSTWRGLRPKLHHALSAPELCPGTLPNKLIKMRPLLESGTTKSALRAHSETPWHEWSNEYATQFGFDIMWEGKDKNLGARKIYEQTKHLL